MRGMMWLAFVVSRFNGTFEYSAFSWWSASFLIIQLPFVYFGGFSQYARFTFIEEIEFYGVLPSSLWE